jgi:hypothetical protein
MKRFIIWAIFSLVTFSYINAQQGGNLSFENSTINNYFNSTDNSEHIFLYNYEGKPLKAIQFKILIHNKLNILSNFLLSNGLDIPESKFMFDFHTQNKYDENGEEIIEISALILGNDFNELTSNGKYHLATIQYNIGSSNQNNNHLSFNFIDVAGATSFPVEDAIISVGNNLTINLTERPVVQDQNKLFQNFPNPFNPATNILYVIEKPGFVNLKIFNSIGEEIETLINEYQNEGEYSIIFNGNSDLPSGVYFYRLQIGNFIESKRMIFIK